MSRRGVSQRRPVPPDSVYNSRLVNMMMRRVMRHGKKSLAARIVYDALKTIEERTGNAALETFEKAVRNATPLVEVKARRIGGATFQIPTEIRPERKVAMGMKWLILYSRKRSGKSMVDKLAAEIMSAANNEGAAVKKKEDTHRMAEANKAFSHFRF